MQKYIRLILFIIFLIIQNSFAYENIDIFENNKIREERWNAYWITYQDPPYQDFGVFHFRKEFVIDNIPESFIIHISADNRYILFCNEKQVCRGPAKGDLENWRFETIDLSPYLKKGGNLLSAAVWNFGIFRPNWQFSYRTGFFIQGYSKNEEIINTNESWKCFHNISYNGIPVDKKEVSAYCVVGPGEYVNGNDYPWGWEKLNFDDSNWKNANIICDGILKKNKTLGETAWLLIPRNIPFMEEKEETIEKIVKQENINISENFLKGNFPFTVSENKIVKILFDMKHLTTAFPEILIDGGKNTEIKLKYSESLYEKGRKKGNRNSVEGKEMRGYYDIFIADGGANRVFKTLQWRTFRYIEMEIKTQKSPIILKDFKTTFTAYPFKETGFFESDNPELEKIWEMDWRTIRLCANETYMDCPYYEQLQYVGDTRLQSLISFYITGDDRLVKNAIELWDDSRIPEGITYSRHPANIRQFIPTYSLEWIGMIHDFWWYREDSEYLKRFLPGIRSVIRWFEQYLNDNYLLGKVPWWNFIDWTDGHKDGVPPQNEKGESSVLSLEFAKALGEAGDLEEYYRNNNNAQYYRNLSKKIINAVFQICWDSEKGLIASTPDKKIFGQHANVLAVLLDMVPPLKQKEIMEKTLTDKSLTQCAYYFQFYLHQAIKKAGFGDKYLKLLEPWNEMIKLGLTTCLESFEPSRSDCHAWSAHPNFNMLSIICGVNPSAPGFKEVEISPNLGNLNWVKGGIAHPKGIINVEYTKTPEGLKAAITLPKGISGLFVWKNKKIKLNEGLQEFIVN